MGTGHVRTEQRLRLVKRQGGRCRDMYQNVAAASRSNFYKDRLVAVTRMRLPECKGGMVNEAVYP